MVVFKIIALDLLVIRHCLVNCTIMLAFAISKEYAVNNRTKDRRVTLQVMNELGLHIL